VVINGFISLRVVNSLIICYKLKMSSNDLVSSETVDNLKDDFLVCESEVCDGDFEVDLGDGVSDSVVVTESVVDDRRDTDTVVAVPNSSNPVTKVSDVKTAWQKCVMYSILDDDSAAALRSVSYKWLKQQGIPSFDAAIPKPQSIRRSAKRKAVLLRTEVVPSTHYSHNQVVSRNSYP